MEEGSARVIYLFDVKKPILSARARVSSTIRWRSFVALDCVNEARILSNWAWLAFLCGLAEVEKLRRRGKLSSG